MMYGIWNGCYRYLGVILWFVGGGIMRLGRM